MRWATLVSLFALPAFCSSAEAATWRLFIPYVDDTMTVTINGVTAYTCNFSETCDWDLTNKLRQGTNTITLKLVNTQNQYSYAYVLYKDAERYAADICGIWNTFPSCNNNLSTGTVMTWTFKIVK